MQTERYYGCCTASILCGFGGTNTSEEYILPDEPYKTAEEIKDEIDRLVHRRTINGEAVVTAITNDSQTLANEALEDYGFQSSGWLTKPNHPETKVKLWWFPLEEKRGK